MKKAISILLTAAMLLSVLSVGASAASAETVEQMAAAQEMIIKDLGRDKVSLELVQTVAHDQKLLKKAALGDLVEINEVDPNGSVTYAMLFEKSTEYITVLEDNEGNIILNVTDYDKYDELIYTKDGQIFLNGKEVTVEDTYAPSVDENDGSASISAVSPGISPNAGVYRHYYGATPCVTAAGKFYSPAGFKSTGKGFTGKTITYGQIIAGITATVLLSTLINAVGPLLPNIMKAALSAGDGFSIVQAALNMKRTELAIIAGECTRKYVDVNMDEHAKTTNNSLYSEYHYNIAVLFGNGTGYTAGRYSFEAT